MRKFARCCCEMQIVRYWYLRQKEAIRNMKLNLLKKTVLLSIISAGMGLAPTTRAAHFTNFLDALSAEVGDRLATIDEDTNSTAADKRALNSAANILDRNTKTLQADLSALAAAATVLNTRFSNDVELTTLESQAVVNYSGEANAELGALNSLLDALSAPPSISNQITQAQEALNRGNADSNSVPVRARAISFALNKLRVAAMQARRLIKAPASLAGHVITITGRESDHDRISITLESNGTYTIPDNGDEGEETGTWSYERTGTATGTVTLTPLTPIGAGSHVLNLKFNSASSGSLATGSQTAGGETIRGNFSIN